MARCLIDVFMGVSGGHPWIKILTVSETLSVIVDGQGGDGGRFNPDVGGIREMVTTVTFPDCFLAKEVTGSRWRNTAVYPWRLPAAGVVAAAALAEATLSPEKSVAAMEQQPALRVSNQ